VDGAQLLNIRSGEKILVRAKATLLATGGGATMYRISSPSLEKSGDGMAMAYRAGANFVDMEMLQFHPTGLLVDDSVATGGLLEEGLRGAGAYLYNRLGERFMERYDSQKLERSTRDVISRSSYLEIAAGRGSPGGGVYLDASHLGEKFLTENFPGMVERCADYGFDLVHDRVEVSPSAHYQMGGVRIDVDCRTNIEGLFVAGEDAGGVHGANRLGGNGVADSIVFGGRAGDTMADYVLGRPIPKTPVDSSPWQKPQRENGENPFALRKELENLMWDKVGVVRRGPDLESAIVELTALAERVERASVDSLPAWNAALDLANLVVVAKLVAHSALIRTESRGAHFRDDFPSPDPKWLKNIVLKPNADFEIDPVRFTRLAPPV
jgi:succinate dehydrogenase/fumarate reductase flavoprotein subunit